MRNGERIGSSLLDSVGQKRKFDRAFVVELRRISGWLGHGVHNAENLPKSRVKALQLEWSRPPAVRSTNPITSATAR